MIGIFEYIVANYTWFLFVIILILLAIIGYYIDKTNFGQGKINDSEESENEIDLDNTTLSEVTNQKVNNANKKINSDENNDLLNSTNIIENNIDSNVLNNNVEFQNLNSLNSQNYIKNNLSEKQNDISNVIDLSSPNVEIINNNQIEIENANLDTINFKKQQNESDSLFDQEEINKFNDEFDLLVPKKEIIETDLLSDIEGLNLDKTQKFDFNDLLDLNDIELPKIKQATKEEQDIWKF